MSTWPSEKVDQLADLRSKKLSFSKCGLALGATRNACIGVANRRRAQGDERFAMTTPTKAVAGPRRRDHARPRKTYEPAERKPPRTRDRTIRLRFESSYVALATAIALPSLRKTLFELGHRDCRFIGVDGLYCGHPVTRSPYCDAHHAIVYRQTKSYRRVA